MQRGNDIIPECVNILMQTHLNMIDGQTPLVLLKIKTKYDTLPTELCNHLYGKNPKNNQMYSFILSLNVTFKPDLIFHSYKRYMYYVYDIKYLFCIFIVGNIS